MVFQLILEFAAAAAAAGLAVFILLRQPGTLATRLFAGGLALLSLEAALNALSNRALLPGDAIGWQEWRLTVSALVPSVWVLFSLVYSRANYREFLGRWSLVVAAAFVVPMLAVLLQDSGLIESRFRDPNSGDFRFQVGDHVYAITLVALVASVIVLANLERTFRSSVGTQRWRIKLVVIGLTVLFGSRIYTDSQSLVTRAVSMDLQVLNATAILICCGFVGFSLHRVGAFSVDLYPSHTLIHRSLALLLAGVYLVGVGVVSKLIQYFGGRGWAPVEGVVVLLALVLLGLLVLSDRVRSGISSFVSRHLKRPAHDYRWIWQTFSERIVGQTSRADLGEAAVRWLSENFSALTVTLWVRASNRAGLQLCAGTRGATPARELSLSDVECDSLVQVFVNLGQPVNLERRKESWADTLRHANPGQFEGQGGNRLVLPLLASKQFLGLVVLADRVGAAPYTVEDLDLMRYAATHLANAFLNLESAEKLIQAREYEALQTMSTFLAHDLKNTASTLSLMLQNLPRHFDKPEFREDALKSLGSCVGRINALVREMSEWRRGAVLQPCKVNLDEELTRTLKPLQAGAAGRFAFELGVPGEVKVDAEQIQKVVANLVLNGLEASGDQGSVQLRSRVQGSWVAIEVTDNGPGIDPEFLRESLFRPFKTTKKKGIGIGLYQCKTIVEAHHGRIEVESAVGRGTTFRVWLPVEWGRGNGTGAGVSA